ncbi:hypothetical protein [Parapontixanthobacter aurantiacus]|uniref:hypothetical protein n=1 Tax=Parapontixanthobacter aurantiacus TaxID=1463599 RepID=UPI00301CBD2E
MSGVRCAIPTQNGKRLNKARKGGRSEPPRTPDGRYIVVRGRLWRTSNPNLAEDERQQLVNKLMDARRAVGAAKRANDEAGERLAHAEVHAAKIALGERGAVWWDDGEPDYNRYLAKNTPYADWWQAAEGGG